MSIRPHPHRTAPFLDRQRGLTVVAGVRYPTMEILLRHAVQWLGMKSSPAVQRPGVLDNEDLFIQDLAELEDDELGPSTLL